MWKNIDPVLILLFAGMLFFTGVLVFVDYFFKSEGQVFQVICSLIAGFSGSFFTRLNPKPEKPTAAEDRKELE